MRLKESELKPGGSVSVDPLWWGWSETKCEDELAVMCRGCADLNMMVWVGKGGLARVSPGSGSHKGFVMKWC